MGWKIVKHGAGKTKLNATGCVLGKVGNDQGKNGNWRRGFGINFSLAPWRKTKRVY
jgi:hypothetical protein